MVLFQDVDREATAAKVIEFFDKPLDHYLAMSGKHRADLRSPVSDGQPKGTPQGNATEDRMLAIWLANQIVDCVALAAQHCSDRAQKYLLGKYADRLDGRGLTEQLNFSAATLSRHQLDALNEFADRFEYQVIRRGLQSEVPDLHVKNEKIVQK